MFPKNLPPLLTGPRLEAELAADAPEMAPLVYDLVYQPSVIMLYGEACVGKSLISTQLGLSVSSGTPVFGHFAVERPSRVYYISLEGHKGESMKRIMRMQEGGLNINPANFAWDAVTRSMNVANEQELNQFCDYVKTWGKPWPSLFIIDSLYGFLRGSLANEETVQDLVYACNVLMNEFGSSIIMLHHPHRAKYNTTTSEKIEEDDPFHGSGFLKNFVDTSYYVTKTDDGVRLTNKKDRFKNCIPAFNLVYNPEFDLVTFKNTTNKPHTSVAKVVEHLIGLRDTGATFTTTKELATSLHLCPRQVQRYCKHPSVLEVVTPKRLSVTKTELVFAPCDISKSRTRHENVAQPLKTVPSLPPNDLCK